MLYEYQDRELLDFVDNPIKNLNYLIDKKSSRNLLSKMLYKFPFFRKLISKKGAKLIFEQLYSDYIIEAEAEFQNLKPSSQKVHNKDDIDKILKAFTEYFSIGLLFENRDERSNLNEEYVMMFTSINLITKLEYHCNRVTEANDLSGEYFHSIAYNEKIWITYFLSEVYLLLSSGNYTLSFRKNDIIINPSFEFKKRMKGYWLSEILESNSKTSDIKTLSDISTFLRKNKSIPNQLANVTVDYILDKVFSINTKYINEAIHENEKYHFLREVIFFSLILECQPIEGNNTVNRKYFLSSNYIRNESLFLIEQALYSKDNARLNNNGGFICKQTESSYCRGPLSFKYGLRKFAGILLDLKQKQLKGPDFKGELGDIFEADYVLNYLEGLNYFGYIPYEGFKSGNKSKIKGYDVDIVLHDEKKDIYYFIQVKYRFSAMPTYLTEQFKFFNEEAFRKGFVKQLLTLKNNFNNQSIRDQLTSKGLSNAKTENSHFILLHNLPFLNFHEYKDIYFYEWNLLRNILQDGKMYWRKDDKFGDVFSSQDIALNKPNEIVNNYLKNNINGEELQKQFKLYEKAKCIFRFGSKNVECQIL